MAWINSDDYYAPGTFKTVAKTFIQNKTEWVAGKCYIIEMDGSISQGKSKPAGDIENWLVTCQYTQPNVFWKRSLWEKSNQIDETLQYSFDYELWLQFAHIQPFSFWIDTHLAYFRKQPESKTITSQKQFEVENRLILKRHRNLVKSVPQKFQVFYQRRGRKANKHLQQLDQTDSVVTNIFQAVYIAPWYLFRPHFYKRLWKHRRKILQACKSKWQ
mgnify:CR=1 FL=1